MVQRHAATGIIRAAKPDSERASPVPPVDKTIPTKKKATLAAKDKNVLAASMLAREPELHRASCPAFGGTNKMLPARKDDDAVEAARDAFYAERAAHYELKSALGAEINLARKLGNATNGARINGGYQYDEYRDALEEFIMVHKAANRAWEAYGKVRMSEDRRRLVAYHEAGHAVIGRVLDIPIKRVTINPKVLNADGVSFTDPTRGPLKQFSPDDVIYSFAGAIAEEKFTGKPSNCSRGDDEFVRYHSRAYLPKDKRRPVRAELKAKTVELVEKHWPEIEEVARELLEVSTVSGERIDVIMDYAPMLW